MTNNIFIGETKPIYRCECGKPYPDVKQAESCGCCIDCNVVIDPSSKRYHGYYQRCKPCKKAYDKTKAKERLEKAQLIDYKDQGHEFIYTDIITGSQDGFFDSLDSLFDTIDDHNFDCDPEDTIEPPEYVYATKQMKFRISAEGIIENALTDHYEDAYDEISNEATEELQKLLDGWCDKQNIVSYREDTKRKIYIGDAVAEWKKDRHAV